MAARLKSGAGQLVLSSANILYDIAPKSLGTINLIIPIIRQKHVIRVFMRLRMLFPSGISKKTLLCHVRSREMENNRDLGTPIRVEFPINKENHLPRATVRLSAS